MLAKKTIALVLLFALTFLMAIGYAVLTDNLFIEGNADIKGKPFEGVYISNVELHSANGVENVSFSFYKPTNLSITTRATRTNGSITYKVTVHNNTAVTYWYINPEFIEDFESNPLINATGGITITTKDHPSDTSSTFNSDDWIPANTYRDFYVTYTFGGSAQSYQSTFINFLFGKKMDSVHDEFVTVLNDTSPNGGYDRLCEYFDEKYSETGQTIIANVGEEKEIFDALFGSELTITIEGEPVPVTVMIRRENVDDRDTGDDYSGTSGAPTGCEYTLYITIDPLDSPTGEAIVYAVSYSNGGVGGSGNAWYQLGQLYEGTADRIDYDTTTPDIEGAVNIYSWEATPNRYEVANGITYLIGQEQGDQYDKLKTLEDIMSTNDQDIFNDIDNSRILKTVYDIVHNSANTGKAGYLALREAFYSAAPFYNIFNNGQEIKVKRECTRAEILPYLEAIQECLDYYNEVN